MKRDKDYRSLVGRINTNKDGIKLIKQELTTKPPRPTIKWKNKELLLRKAIVMPNFTNRTVLTDSNWRFVEIYLKSNNQDEALFYWEQASYFFEATKDLPLVSAPLTTYYCFLNATKALLTSKKISYNLKHGVSGKRIDGHFNLQNEKVILKPKGVLSGLCNYLGEPISPSDEEYSLKDILYNLQYIHRAFTVTYANVPELFIPIVNPRFVFDKYRQEGWFEAQLEEKHSNKRTVNKLIGFGLDRRYPNKGTYTIRRNKTFHWDAPQNVPTQKSINSFQRYYKNNRKLFRYIYSPNNLWYIKRKDIVNRLIDKDSLSLTYAGMHRLSELARYQPHILKKHFERNATWLLSEFISKSIVQFLDHISAEITGEDFRVTGFRS